MTAWNWSALRHSTAFRAWPALLLAEFVTLAERHQEWAVEWAWAIDWQNFAIAIVGPLLAGVAAFEVRRLSLDGRAEFATVAGMRGRSSAVHLGTIVIWGWFAHAVGLAAMSIVVLAHGTAGHPSLAAILPSFALLFAYSCVGWLVGSAWTARVAAPFVALGLFIISELIANTGWSSLVGSAGGSTSYVGMGFRPEVLVAQSVWWLGLGGVLLVGSLGVRNPWRTGRWVAASAVSAAPAVAGLIAVFVAGNNPLRAEPIRVTCHTGNPVVCVTPDYAKRVETARRTIEPTLRDLRAVGVRTPDRLTMDQHAAPRQGTAIVAGATVTGDSSSAVFDLVAYYATCPAGAAGAKSRSHADAAANLDWWISARRGNSDASAEPVGVPQGVVGADLADQGPWVRRQVSAAQCRATAK